MGNNKENQISFKFQVSSFKILFFIVFVFLTFPSITEGAILYLEPSSGQYQPGDTFLVGIKIDTEGECINVIESNLKFSQDILKAVDFSQGNSIITLWVKQPEINQESGLISFSGGVPNGYCGRVLGDPKTSNLLGKVIFKVPEMMVGESGKLGEVKFLGSSQVFLNDGKGTEAKLIIRGAIFNILTEKLELSPKDEWKEEIEKDDIPPESFNIEISRNPAIFEGKYFITFSAVDKQTGIDHYKVKEGKRDWKIITSPYVLENQKLTNNIQVKAIDKAGNERIEVVKAPQKSVWTYILYGGLFLILLLIIIKAIRRTKKL